MATKTFDAGAVVTDIWYKRQRIVRTLVQVAIPAFITFAGVLPVIINSLGLPVDGPVYLWLLGAAGVVTAVATALSRVMAIPAVNAWLTQVGLGSVPKSAAVETARASQDERPDEADPAPGEGDALVAGDGLTEDTAK